MNYFKTAVLRVLLLSVFSALVLTVNAGGILRIKPVAEKNRAKAVVSFTNIEAKSVVISIEDVDREIIYYQERFKDVSDFSKVFDLTLLEDGFYVINIKAGNEVLNETVQIVDTKLTIEGSKKMSEPIFKLKDDVLLIYMNQANKDFYSVNFFDGSDVFFSDDLEASIGVKKYSLEKIPNGAYSVFVTGKDATFSYDFSKE